MRIIEQHIECPFSNCNSSDAYCLYEDGHGYCYSCKQWHPPEDTNLESWIAPTTYQLYQPWRGLTEQTMRKYNIQFHYPEGHKEPCFVSFPSGEGVKYRTFDTKKFFTNKKLNSESPLFGQDIFPPNSSRIITITEGELNAASVYQMFGSRYPCVACGSSSDAKKRCSNQYDYLNSFNKIYLCFDNDPPGKKAAQQIASLFDFRKVYIVNLQKHNDPNDYLTQGDEEAFRSEWWGAQRYTPENLVSSYQDIEEILQTKDAPTLVDYPFQQLQNMTYGIRSGEIVLLSGLEGMGKTEIMRALEYHTLLNTDHNIGIIHLEESQARNVKGLLGYHLSKPLHLPDHSLEPSELLETYQQLTKREDRVYFFSCYITGDTAPDDFLESVRFLVTCCDCKIIFFDHITMLATGSKEDDERRLLDNISTNLALMVDELDFALVMVSHVNDNGDTRGSKNISKVSDLHVQLFRDIEAEQEEEQNRTYLTIKKNRFAGPTGKAGVLTFNPETFKVDDNAYF